MSRETDPLDAAARLTEEATQRAVDEARNKASVRELKVTGRCHWCRDLSPKGHLFCDEHCRDDWHNAEAAKRRKGG